MITDSSSNNRVVTVIEILSPANKMTGPSNRQYLEKLDALRAGSVSIVEVDFIRSRGRDNLEVVEEQCRSQIHRPYVYAVRLGWEPQKWRVWAFGFRRPAPPLVVPLRRADPELSIPMQPLLDRVYEFGRHDDIDYSNQPPLPLNTEDRSWLESRLRDRAS